MRLVLILSLTMIFGCSQHPANGLYGEDFDTTKAVNVTRLLQSLKGKNRVETAVRGTISSSCQDDGCWLELNNPNGEPVHVDWDEKFHLPTDIESKNVMVNGYAYRDSMKDGNPVVFKANGVRLLE